MKNNKLSKIIKTVLSGCLSLSLFTLPVYAATIEEKINSMDDKLLSELLFQKYVLGHNLSDVSYQINYSKRQTERFHRKALEKFVM